MEYTVFRNLTRRRLLKDLEEEFIHEKGREYDNEAIKNDFARSCLVRTTRNSPSSKQAFLKISQISQELSLSIGVSENPSQERETEQLENIPQPRKVTNHK